MTPKASFGLASEFKAILGLLRVDQKQAIKPRVVGNHYSELVGNGEHLGVSVRCLQRRLAEERDPRSSRVQYPTG